MYNFTANYIDGFKAGIKGVRSRHFTPNGKTISSYVSINSTDIFFDCVYLAYCDACRKFSGISKINNAKKDSCFSWLAMELLNYFNCPFKTNEVDFDVWHEQTCKGFIGCFCKIGYNKVTVGMAQKVINLSFKYLHCCNWGSITGDYFKFCHMALDDNTLMWYTRIVNPSNKIKEWSPLNNYAEYSKIQKNIRVYLTKNYAGNIRESLLVNEFYIFPDELIVQALINLRDAIDSYSNCNHLNSEIKTLYLSNIDPKNPSSTINSFISHF